MRFADVIGQGELKRILAKGVDEGRVSHAQLFSGRPGSGALPLALAYAQYVNCAHRSNGDSCGVCPSCVKMAALAHPDFHFVFPVNSPKGSGGSQKPLSDTFLPQWRGIVAETGGYFDEQDRYAAISIDNQQGVISRNEADEIIRKLSFKPFEAGSKVMVIWLPEKMRPEAANTILKILEEPWERTLFIMVTEAPERLLSTIISRMQEVAVPAIETADMESWLAGQYGLSGEKLSSMARISLGDVIEARRLASGQAESNEEYFELFTSLMRLSYNDRHMELLEWADGVALLGREQQKKFLEYSVRMLRESYMMNAGMTDITYLWGGELEFCRKFSPFIGNHNIEKLVSEMELAIRQIGQNGNPRIIFPHFALSVSKLIVRL